jgi:hypothetical protein
MQKFMIIERFRAGCWDAAYERFHEQGRLLPDGLKYLNSWINKELNVCYQLMETGRPELFDVWFGRWEDLVEFELVPID